MSDNLLTPWRVKKMPDDSFAYLVPDAEIKVDGQKMMAHVIVSTATMDRERDILLSKGCRTANHQKIPAVMVNHRKDWPAVARAEDPAGNYTVKCYDDRVESYNWFNQSSKLGLQTFRLVESKALAGVSPGFMTVPDCVQKIKGTDGRPAYLYTAWDLVEISHCPIPMNPDALVLAVEKGFGGESLLPELKDMLLPFVPKKKAAVVGGWEEKTFAVEPSPDIDLTDAEAVPLTPSTQFYHAVREKAFDLLCMVQELANVQELERTKADGRRIVGLVGGVLDTCLLGHSNHVNDFPDQPGLPDGANAEILSKKMAEWRVKALDAWDTHKRAMSEAAVATESAADVKEAVRFCQTLAADRQQRTSVRTVAKKMADRLLNVKMVAVPVDADEEAEWGEVAKKLDAVVVGG